MSSGMDSRNFTGERVMPTRKPSEELRAAMPEETKPVEREAFEEWAVGYGLSIGVEAGTKLYWQLSTTFAWESWQASADAALERAAQIAQREAWHGSKDCGRVGEHIAAEIRALKGRE